MLLVVNVQNMEQIVRSITTNDLEWCANWQMEDKYHCSLVGNQNTFKGFNKLMENMFGSKYGGFRYDRRRYGYEVWFRNKDDMLTLKLLTQKRV